MTEQLGQVQGSEEQASTIVAWDDRRDQLLDQARALEGREAVDRYVEALLLVDRKLPGDFQVAEIWGEILQRAPSESLYLWEKTSRKLTTTAAAWQNISEACAANGGDPQVLLLHGLVQALRADQFADGKAKLANAPAGSIAAQYNDLIAVAETKNWKKIEDGITQQLTGLGLSGDALKVETAHRVADFATGLAMADRALSTLQAIEKAKIVDHSVSHRVRLLYRDTAKWNNYVNGLKAAIDETQDTPERIEIYLEMVQVYRDQMKLDAMVGKSYEAILDLDPTYGPAYDALEETYDGMRRFPDLVKLLQRRLENSKNTQARIALNLKIANVYIDKLARPQNAVEFYEAILQLDPHHATAIAALKDIYEKRRDFEKLIDIHRAEIQTMATVGEKLARLREVADIATQKLKKAPVAITVWSEILDLAPSDADAIENLDQLYRREKDWEHVAQITERKAELASDEKERLKHWTEVGSLYVDRAKNNTGAIRAWRQVLTLEPTNAKALDALRKLFIEERAWGDLEDLFAARDAWAELSKIFEKEAATAKDNADIIALLFRASRIHREHLGDTAKGIELLERTFETDPKNEQAALTLTPYYEAASKHAPLADMLTIRLGHISDIDARLPLSIKLAALYERDLANPAEAFSWFSRALNEHPRNPDLYEHVQRSGTAAKQYQAVVDRLQRALDQSEDDDSLRRDLKLRIGLTLGDHLNQIDQALEIFDAVIAEDPDSTRALGAKVGLLERTGRFEQLIDVNERRLALTNDPAERAEILLVSARIHENNRKDVPTAIAVYEDVRALLPRDQRALVELRRLYRIANKFDDLADTLRNHLDLIQQDVDRDGVPMVEVRLPVDLDDDGMPVIPEDATSEPEIDDDGEMFVRVMRPAPSQGLDPRLAASLPLWFELGQVAQSHIKDLDESVEAFRRVLVLDPTHDGARLGLEGILAAEPDQADKVARILEPVYATRNDHEQLVKMLRVQFDNASDDAERFNLLTRTADLVKTHLDRPADAFEDLARALTIRPDATDVFDSLEAFADVLDAWTKLAQRLEAIANDLADAKLRTVYLMKLAEVLEKHLNNKEKALEFGRVALDLSRADADTLAALLDVFTRLDAWDDAVNVLRARVELTPEVNDQIDIKLQMAEIVENMLANKPDAVAIYLDILRDAPENDAALKTLDRLYEELEQWQDLASNLERRAELQEDLAVRDDILCKLACTLQDHLADPSRAIDLFRDILSRNPDNEPAIATLRKMLALPDLAEHAETIADVLLPVYDMRDDWHSRIQVDEHRLAAASDPEARIALLHEIAGLYEEHSEEDPDGQEAAYLKAFDTYTRALPIDPNHETTLERLNTYAEVLNNWQLLVDKMEAVIQSVLPDQPDTAHQLLVRVARINRDQLANQDAAVNAFERASATNDQDLEVVEALEALYQERSAWGELIKTLARKVALLDDLDAKKAILYRAATISEEFSGDETRAQSIDLYRDVLSLDDNDDTALDELERLYNETLRWEDLIGIYQIKVDRLSDPEPRLPVLHALGAVQETRTKDIPGAIDTYNQILSIDPNDVPSLEALDRLYLQTEDFSSLRDILEREEVLADDFTRQLELRYRRGEVLEKHLESTPQAIELYQSILETDAAHAATIAALAGIVTGDDPDNQVAAARVLEPAYKQLEQWAKLTDTYEVLITHESDPTTRIALLATKAEIQEDPARLNLPNDAFNTWLRALQVDPEQDLCWESLRRIAEAQNLWETLAAKGSEILQKLEEIPQVSAVVSNLAAVYIALGRRDDAIGQWKHLLTQDPTNELALNSLADLYENAEMWDDLVQTLNHKIEITYDQDAVIALRLRLGLLCAEILKDGPQAIDHFRSIHELSPGHPDAIAALQGLFNQGVGQIQISEILAPFYAEVGFWAQLIDLHLELLKHPDKDSDARYELLLEVATLYLERIAPEDESAIASAITIYGLALNERPDDAFALSQIERLSADFSLWAEAIGAYTGALAVAKEPPARNELLWRCATVYLEHIQDPDHAEHYFLQLLGLPEPPKPEDPDAPEALLSASDPATLPFLTSLDAQAIAEAIDSERALHAFVALDSVYYAREQWPALAEVVRHQVTLVPSDDDRVQLLLRLGQIRATTLDRVDDAIASYAQALEINPAEHQALDALIAIYESRENWTAYFETLERKADVLDSPTDRADIWARMAVVASDILEKPTESIGLWFQVIEARGDNLEALQALESLYLQAEDWDEFLGVIERQVPLLDDLDLRLEAFRKMGRTCTAKLNDVYRALPYWKQAQETNAQDFETLNAIKALDEQLGAEGDMGAVQDLAAVLTAILGLGVLSAEDQLAHYIQLGTIYTDQLSMPENAITVWEMVLEIEYGHAQAIENLERLYNDSALWDKAASLLERKAALASEDQAASTALLLDAAAVWSDQAMQPAEANRVLRSILAQQPLHEETFSRLEALLTSTENWQELVTTYLERVELFEAPEPRLDLRRRAALIAENHIGDAEIAFGILLDALQESWRDKTLALDLEVLAEKTNQWSLLIESYGAILKDIQGTVEAIVLHNTFGRWYYLKVTPPEYNRSWQHFQDVLRFDANNLDAYEGLAEIYSRLSQSDPNQFGELVKIQTRRAELLNPEDAEQRELKVKLYNQVGHIWEENLAHADTGRENAVVSYRKSVELDDQHLDSINRLSHIFETQGRWLEQVEVLELRATALTEPDEAVATRFLIGQRWENQLSDYEKAVEAYNRVIAADEAHAQALERLEELLTRLERWEPLLEVYNKQLAISLDTDAQVEIYKRISRVHEENLQDREKAIASIREIGYIAPQNLDAISTLERLLRDAQQWDDLSTALQQHIDLAPDNATKIKLYIQRGEVYRDHLQDPYEAISNFQQILNLDPQNQDALLALADIYETLTEWRSCISFLDALAAAIPAAKAERRAETLQRIGALYWQRLEDDASAERYFQSAIGLIPSFMPSLDSLRDLYFQRGDFNSVIHILKQKVSHTREIQDRAALFCQIGLIYDRSLNNSINAIDYYQQTIDLDPQNIEAAKPLAAVYVREQNWARAELLLHMLVDRLANTRDDDLYMLLYSLGLSLEELGQDEQAVRRYRESYEYNTQHTPTLLRMGRLLYKQKDFTRAFTSFQTLLTDHLDNLSNKEIVTLLYDCGEIKRETGEIGDAQQFFYRAMEYDRSHEPSLAAMIKLCEEQEQWEHVVEYKRYRLSASEDETQKLSELVSIGDVCLEHIGSPERAVAAYQEALAMRPGSLAILKKLLDLYTKGQQWAEVVEILKQIAKMERDSTKRALLHYSVAAFYRDKLDDEVHALEYYNLTLDDDVNQLKAFEAIDRILTSRRDWQSLERNYRKMIKRVYDDGNFGNDMKFLLYYGLGETYRTRLGKWDDATAAFQQAVLLRPEDLNLHRILADLYVRQNRLDEAIKTFHTMIHLPLDPAGQSMAASNRGGEVAVIQQRNVEFYHALFNLYMNTRQLDQAWCISNLLTHLRAAETTEAEFHNRYFGAGLPSTQGRFTNEIWALVSHPTENMRIGNIMAVISGHCRDLFSYDIQDQYGMRKKNKLALSSNLLFCKIYQYMAGMIGVVPAPELYLNAEQPLGMINGNVNPPAFIIGADMTQGRSQRELAFIIARQLALASPQHYMGALGLQTEMLKTYMMASIHVCSQNPGKVADSDFNDIVKQLSKMPTPVKMELMKMMKPILEGQVEVSMSSWLRAIDLTANRIGLLLCGDLATAIQSVRNDNRPISKLSTSEKEKDLLAFAISSEYFDLRQRLGLSV